MPYKKPTNITSWSNSKLGTYTQCPLKAKLSYIDKAPSMVPKSDAMKRGADIHTMAEQYLRGQLPRIPAELKFYDKLFKDLRAAAKKSPHLVTIEDNWAFRKDWSETTWDDWKECWVRIKLDAAQLIKGPDGEPVLIINDWKTGKFRIDDQDSYIEQLSLYALAGLIKFAHLAPHGLVVKPRLVYLDAHVIYPRFSSEELVYKTEELPALKKAWEKRVKPMLSDTKFAPRPNKFCGWCEFGKSKGGTCEFG